MPSDSRSEPENTVAQLFRAIQNNDLDATTALIQSERLNFVSDDDGIFDDAALEESLKPLRQTRIEGKPLLHYAKSSDTARLLMEYGFHPLSKDDDRKTFIGKLEPTHENLSVIEAIAEKISEEQAYILQADLGKLLCKIPDENYDQNAEVEDKPLDLGANVFQQGTNGKTPVTNTRLPERWRKYADHPSARKYYDIQKIPAFDLADASGDA
jgi:hypothetical protein